MKDKISIMHISDSHRGKDTLITNSSLLTSLINDKERYTTFEEPLIRAPDIIIVCGDIIRGSEHESNSKQKIQYQYDEAIGFLTDLANEFIDGNKHRVVLVPGNHDVDWKYSRESMVKIDNSTFGGANSSLFPLQLGRLTTMKAKICNRFAHYQVKHGIYDTLRQFIGLA